MFICVYCAFYSHEIIDFRFKKKDGIYSTKMFKCPNCNAVMKENTIKMNMSVSQWVEYLYLNIRVTDGYFKKVKWEEYFEHLKNLGISKPFWDYWKVYKSMCEGKSKLQLFNELMVLTDKVEYKPVKQSKLGTFILPDVSV